MRFAVYLSVVGALLSVDIASAQAPSYAEQRMQDRIERLERELITLQKALYGSEGAGQNQKPMAIGPGQQPPPSQRPAFLMQEERRQNAQLSVKVQALEEQMQALEGKLEKIEFEQRQLRSDYKKLASDIDFRLRDKAMKAKAKSSQAAEDGTKILGTVKVEKPPQRLRKEPEDKTFETPKAHYNAAFSLVKEARYNEAEDLFHEFIKDYPEDSRVGHAYYWLGETYYVRKQYDQASVEFLQGYKHMPKGPKAPDNLLKLGMSLGMLNKEKEACTVYKKLLNEFPNASVPIKQRVEQERTRLHCVIQ